MRYIDSLNLNADIECFILIEPGLGYIADVLYNKFPNSKIIILHIDKNFPEKEGFPAFYGTEIADLNNFLENEAPETDASKIKIIEWRPSLNYYKEEYLKLILQTTEFIKRMEAGRRTTAAFGKKWIKNFLYNLENINHVLLYKKTDLPVIITGSGPSLENSISIIKRHKNNCLIIAASSSVMALAHNNITPDIIISTDGGNWALRHLYQAFRDNNNFVFAVNLCAALPSQIADSPFLVLTDASLWQNVILHELSLPSVIIPQRGTVSASAVDLALQLTSGNIYLTGMDLRINDIKTHARPYAFDNLLFENANRISPVYSQNFIRSRQLQDGKSYDIYAAWFKKQFSAWPKRIFYLDNDIKFSDDKKNTDNYFKAITLKKYSDNIHKKAVTALLSALKNKEFSCNIINELSPMLFPNKKDVSGTEIESILKEEIFKFYCKGIN